MTLQAMDRTQINGVELEVRDRGSGEPVVFVHGAMGDECAAVLTEPLLANQYRLIDYHRRGWGNSARLQAPLSIEQQAADDHLARRLGRRSCRSWPGSRPRCRKNNAAGG